MLVQSMVGLYFHSFEDSKPWSHYILHLTFSVIKDTIVLIFVILILPGNLWQGDVKQASQFLFLAFTVMSVYEKTRKWNLPLINKYFECLVCDRHHVLVWLAKNRSSLILQEAMKMINTTDIVSKVDIILQTQISVMKESYTVVLQK